MSESTRTYLYDLLCNVGLGLRAELARVDNREDIEQLKRMVEENQCALYELVGANGATVH